MSTAFSNIFSQLRHERGLSQRQVAADLDISQALLSHYENGLREPRIEFIVKICDYYGVSADYLFGRTKLRADTGELTKGLKAAEVEKLGRMMELAVELNSAGRSRGKDGLDTVSKYLELAVLKALLYMDAPGEGVLKDSVITGAGLIRICDILQMRTEAAMGATRVSKGREDRSDTAVEAIIRRLEPELRKELGGIYPLAEGENR